MLGLIILPILRPRFAITAKLDLPGVEVKLKVVS
jgi:hypothetical protein